MFIKLCRIFRNLIRVHVSRNKIITLQSISLEFIWEGKIDLWRLVIRTVFMTLCRRSISSALINMFTHRAEPFLRSRQLCSYSRTSKHFMEPDGLLTSLQVLHSFLSWARWIRSIPSYLSQIIMSTHLRLGLPGGLFPSGFPTNILYAFLFCPFVLHAMPI
jgi:hypothetical protein